jgi:hypothetical protein
VDVEELRAFVAHGFAGAKERWFSVSPLQWWWEAEDAFRVATIGPPAGDVSLVEGGAVIAAGDWRAPLGAVQEALRSASRWASYGFIKRGSRVSEVGHSLRDDWVPAPHFGPGALTHSLYEDVLAPDAFGEQIFGAGYARRVPGGECWKQVELTGSTVLVAHRDPEAWFAQRLPVPEVISAAREDFAPILITHDIVAARPPDPLAGR